MVDRGHLKDALAVGELKVADLQHNGEHLQQVGQRDQQQDELHIHRQRDRAHDTAEEERAGVAHEHLCGVEVPDEEAQTSARDSRRIDDVALMVADHVRDQHQEQAREEGDRAVQTVDAVREVDGVHDTDQDDRHDRIVRKAEVDRTDEGHHDRGVVLAQRHQEQVDRRRRELEHQLLDRRQTEVALLDDLDIVVDEADTAVEQREQQTDEHKAADGVQPAVGHAEQQNARGRRDDDADDEHDTAHRGSTLLALMPFRTVLEDGLTEFQLMQEGNERLSDQSGQRKGDCRRAESP